MSVQVPKIVRSGFVGAGRERDRPLANGMERFKWDRSEPDDPHLDRDAAQAPHSLSRGGFGVVLLQPRAECSLSGNKHGNGR